MLWSLMMILGGRADFPPYPATSGVAILLFKTEGTTGHTTVRQMCDPEPHQSFAVEQHYYWEDVKTTMPKAEQKESVLGIPDFQVHHFCEIYMIS